MKSRTFLFTFILFLMFFFSGILLTSVVTLKSNLESSKDRSLREHYFIVSSYVKDLNALEGRGISVESGIDSLYRTYSTLYSKQKVIITVSKNGEQLFSDLITNSARFSNPPQPTKTDERYVSMKKLDGKEYIRVVGALPVPYAEYTLTYYYDVSDVFSSWNKVTMMLFMAGMIFSGLLAICLYFVLNRIFKPLQQISIASKNIALGQYGNQIVVKGDDELAEMAISFNHMAEEIQNQMRQLATAADQKQQFIDNLSHELRTPLTSIYGYAEYIQKIVRTEDDKLFATNVIMSESLRLQNIANRLLDMATFRSKSIKKNDLQIKQLFCGVEQSMSMIAEEQKIQITYDYHFDTLFCETDMIHILLVNLIDNAMKACGENGIIKVTATIENGFKVISVQDNGKGMSQDQLIHITEPFYRIDASRSRSIGGAGLGLSLCEQIAENHEAELSFLSETGKGTTAKITFTNP